MELIGWQAYRGDQLGLLPLYIKKTMNAKTRNNKSICCRYSGGFMFQRLVQVTCADFTSMDKYKEVEVSYHMHLFFFVAKFYVEFDI